MADIGKRNWLPVVRDAAPGLYLDGGAHGEILLPNRYAPHVLPPGELVDVFVYLDSEDRLVASTETPLAMVGELACLRVLSVNRQVGAFLDWGLSKDLLLPFREQSAPVRVGQWIIVRVLFDEETGRIVASAKLDRFLNVEPPDYSPGEPVSLLITGRTPLGCNAIIDHAHRGLLYDTPGQAPLAVGQRVRGYVRQVRPDGKIDLTLDASGYDRVSSLADRIIEALERNGGELDFDDDSPPQAIRAAFDASKKAFKQAVGALYRERRIVLLKPGIALAGQGTPPPGAAGRDGGG